MSANIGQIVAEITANTAIKARAEDDENNARYKQMQVRGKAINIAFAVQRHWE